MPGCVLHVTGSDLDPGALDLGALAPYARFRRGERCAPTSKRVHESGGFKCLVSERAGDDLAGQLADAVAFLRLHHDALAAIVRRADVEVATLDFGHFCRLRQRGSRCRSTSCRRSSCAWPAA